MWADAAKWLYKFPEAVVTVTDEDGYPASVRTPTRAYDAATGELPVSIPEALRLVEGPANLLCHSHNEKLWNLQMISVKGKLVKSDSAWVFRSEAFQAPSKLAMLDFVRNARKSAQRYLDKRGLPRPTVDWAAVKEVQRLARSRGR